MCMCIHTYVPTYIQQSKEKGLGYLFFPISLFFLCLRNKSTMMHNKFNYANKIQTSINGLTKIFIFSGDPLNWGRVCVQQNCSESP